MPSMMGTANRNIMVVPCMVKNWLNSSGPSRLFSGDISCRRMISASTPARAKKISEVTMKR